MDDRMKAPELRLLGRILAGQTHDLTNVLAILRESAGLIEDLGSAGPKGAAGIARALATMERVFVRGTEQLERLNRYAHSMDDERTGLALEELATQACFLMQRTARLRRGTISMEAAGRSGEIPVGPQPARLILALCACIGNRLPGLSEGSEMRLRLGAGEGQASIRIECEPSPDPAGPVEERDPELDATLADLGCALEWPGPGAAGAWVLALPILRGAAE